MINVVTKSDDPWPNRKTPRYKRKERFLNTLNDSRKDSLSGVLTTGSAASQVLANVKKMDKKKIKPKMIPMIRNPWAGVAPKLFTIIFGTSPARMAAKAENIMRYMVNALLWV